MAIVARAGVIAFGDILSWRKVRVAIRVAEERVLVHVETRVERRSGTIGLSRFSGHICAEADRRASNAQRIRQAAGAIAKARHIEKTEIAGRPLRPGALMLAHQDLFSVIVSGVERCACAARGFGRIAHGKRRDLANRAALAGDSTRFDCDLIRLTNQATENIVADNTLGAHFNIIVRRTCIGCADGCVIIGRDGFQQIDCSNADCTVCDTQLVRVCSNRSA